MSNHKLIVRNDALLHQKDQLRIKCAAAIKIEHFYGKILCFKMLETYTFYLYKSTLINCLPDLVNIRRSV